MEGEERKIREEQVEPIRRVQVNNKGVGRGLALGAGLLSPQAQDRLLDLAQVDREVMKIGFGCFCYQQTREQQIKHVGPVRFIVLLSILGTVNPCRAQI